MFDLFDPRRRPEDEASGRQGGEEEYKPRHPRKGMSSSGEYRPRHPIETESSNSSPSPEKEGGDDDFEVFNFDKALRRKKEREDMLNAQLAAAERPRRTVERIAENQPRKPARPAEKRPARVDSAVKRAAEFASKLSSYAAPLAPMNSTRSSGSAPRKKSASSAARSSGGGTRRAGSSGGKDRKKTQSSWFSGLSPAKKAAVVCVCAFLGLVILYYSAFGIMLSGMGSLELGRRDKAGAAGVADMELMSAPGVTNILLLGIDDDGSSGSRSDTIMLASLDSGNNTIRLCSILRDCYVEIPGYKSSRINAAYAYGGAQLAVHTVESNFRVKIDHCVTIDMKALVAVVDAMGGVEIELTAAEANQVNLHSHCGLTTEAGLQLLNGKQAVTYAQIRKIDSDFMRTQRQRTLINAIVAKLKGLGVGELMGVVQAVAPNVSTDMGSARIASLAIKALPALGNEMGQMTIPSDGKYKNETINGMSVLKLDLPANAKLLRSYLYEKD